ncbi:hypothetical protein GQ54DRAFT_299409 [Martensiomyces pterosporus]|nr:hypothetical protein GQ54DRAFT_299409 [Martensiomyces pterosporus]
MKLSAIALISLAVLHRAHAVPAATPGSGDGNGPLVARQLPGYWPTSGYWPGYYWPGYWHGGPWSWYGHHHRLY